MTAVLDATQSLAERAVLAGAVAENVPSPCVSVCRMDPQRTYCEGCLRSIDEIKVWRASSDLEKKAIWARIAERAAAHSPKVI
jgi:predicted Fe-S protein YdhL (DUF1289 family)